MIIGHSGISVNSKITFDRYFFYDHNRDMDTKPRGRPKLPEDRKRRTVSCCLFPATIDALAQLQREGESRSGTLERIITEAREAHERIGKR